MMKLAQRRVKVDQTTERIAFSPVSWINRVPRHHMGVESTSEFGFVRSSQHSGNLLHFGTRETAGWPVTEADVAIAHRAPACVDEALRQIGRLSRPREQEVNA